MLIQIYILKNWFIEHGITPPQLKVSKADEFLGNIGGKWSTSRNFYKLNDGDAICCLFKYSGDWNAPLLVAKTPEAAQFYYVGTGNDTFPLDGVREFSYNNKKYYFSTGYGFSPIVSTDMYMLNYNANDYTANVAGYTAAAIDLLDLYYGVE